MIDSTLTSRLTFACPCIIYAYTHPLSAVSVKCSSPSYLSIIIPFRKVDSPPEITSDLTKYLQRALITLAKPSTNIYTAISTKPPALKPIVHHVFRSQNQTRNGNHYPIPFPIPTLQPRNERLLEMLQMSTHQQPSGVITLLRQLPACER